MANDNLGVPVAMDPWFAKWLEAFVDGKIAAISTVAEPKFRCFRPHVVLPRKGTQEAAAMDVCAWVMKSENTTTGALSYINNDGVCVLESLESIQTYEPTEEIIQPGEMKFIKTGLNLRIPKGYAVLVLPRSGLAAKYQITVQNTPGLIDCDYDGDGEAFEAKIMLRNEGYTPFVVKHGDRIAQFMLIKLPASLNWVEEFGDNPARIESDRTGGFGTTGVV